MHVGGEVIELYSQKEKQKEIPEEKQGSKSK